MLTAICKGNSSEDYVSYEGDFEKVVNTIVYVTDSHSKAGLHESMGEDAGVYVDRPQYDDRELDENELYVVKYATRNGKNKIDMGLTKDDILDNVCDGKYSYGAEYWTFGNMLKTTRDYWNNQSSNE